MMLKEQANTFLGISRAADLGIIAVSFASAATICPPATGPKPLAWVPGLGGSPDAAGAFYQYPLLFFFSLIAWLAVAQWRDTYRSHRAEGYPSVLWQNLITQVLWGTLTGFCVFVFKLQLVSRLFFLTFLPLSMLLLNVKHTGIRIALTSARLRGFNLRSVAIIGDPDRVTLFSELMKRENDSGYRVLQEVHVDAATFENLSDTNVDEVFVLIGSGLADLERLILKLLKLGKRVHIVAGILDASPFRQSLGNFAGVPVLSIGGFRLEKVDAGAKRLLDICGSTILFGLLAPMMAMIALLIKISSPGPVVFAQERLGEHGRRFRIYKFRTMCVDAEKTLESNPALYQKYIDNNYKLPKGEDPRITPLGVFLRRTSLDELPQLFNVLKGDMSLVGPRPIVPAEIDKYGEYGQLFISVKPGLTGNWQTSGRSDITDYSRRAVLDIEYIRDQSLKTDVDILLKTIPAVVWRKGAH
jgi:exopolysaccharide production protein ExoY